MLGRQCPCWKAESSNTAIGSSPRERVSVVVVVVFFPFQHTLSHPFTLPILQAWHLLAATPPQLPGAQSGLWKTRWDPVARQLPKLSCPPLPTGWVPGLSYFHGLSPVTGLSHRQLSLASLFFFFFLTALRSMWDFSSQTKNRIHVPLQWKRGLLITGLPGKSLSCFSDLALLSELQLEEAEKFREMAVLNT